MHEIPNLPFQACKKLSSQSRNTPVAKTPHWKRPKKASKPTAKTDRLHQAVRKASVFHTA